MYLPRRLIVSIIFLLCVSKISSESEPNLIINQTSLENEQLISFISFNDVDDLMMTNIRKENFSIMYGLQEGEVKSLTPFTSAQFGASYIFLVDISKSVSKESFKAIKDSIKSWISSLNPGDAAAILTFGEEVKVLSGLTYDRQQLLSSVENILRTDMKTKLYDGIEESYSIATQVDKRFPSRKAIICLTDGINESEKSISKEELLKLFEEKSIPFYAINFSEDQNSDVTRGSRDLEEISDISRGYFFNANETSIERAYKSARQYIDEALMLISTCDSCDYNDSLVNLEISYRDKDLSLKSSTKLRLVPLQEVREFPKGERTESWKINYLVLSLIITLAVVFLLSSLVRKRQKNQKSSASETISLNVSPNLEDSINIKITSISANLEDQFNVEVTDKCTIGRSSRCDVSIKDQPEISGKHCVLEWKNGSLFISDLDSRNGTYVNGVPIKDKYVLSNRDIIGMGRAEFRLIFEGED